MVIKTPGRNDKLLLSSIPSASYETLTTGSRQNLPILRDRCFRAHACGLAILLPILLAITILMQTNLLPGILSTTQPESESHPLEFVIPKDALSSGGGSPIIDSAIAIPRQIAFGSRDDAALVIRNDDVIPQRAGPWIVQPGQTFSIHFDKPGLYDFVCSQNQRESVQIVVDLTDINGVPPAHDH